MSAAGPQMVHIQIQECLTHIWIRERSECQHWTAAGSRKERRKKGRKEGVLAYRVCVCVCVCVCICMEYLS